MKICLLFFVNLLCVTDSVAAVLFELELVDFTTAHLYKCGLRRVCEGEFLDFQKISLYFRVAGSKTVW